MDKKQIQILAGTGGGGLVLGFILGWMTFAAGGKIAAAEKAAEKAKKEATKARAGEAKAKKALGEAQTKAQKDLNALRSEKDGVIGGLKKNVDEQTKLKERLAIDKKALSERNDALRKERDIATSRSTAKAKDVPATAELVAALGNLRNAQADLYAARAEVIARFEGALAARPEVGPLKNAVSSYRAAVGPFQKAAKKVESVLSNNSKTLKASGVDMTPGSPHRKGIGDKLRKDAEKLANLFDAAVAAVESDKIAVRAKSKGWTESEVTVEAQQQVFVHAVGSWKSKYDWAEKDARGWPGEAQVQFRVKPSLPFGCLIVRVQGQETEQILPAYGSDPITLVDPGRLEFRMNDKREDDNSGSMNVEIIRISHDGIRRALKAAKK